MKAFNFIIRIIIIIPMYAFGLIGESFEWIAGKLEDFLDWYLNKTK